jgi:isoleucyl-tRNA synthetase
VEIACRSCGARVPRIPDVGNPWLDAGVVGMSTLQYRQDRAYWRRWFPADLISESFPGQFRNWFYSLIAMSTILERKAPFRHVFTYATLLAEDGRPMHKSWGNSIEFNEAADRMGVDVMRWLYCDHKPEKVLLFGYHRADEVRRQFLIPLWNVYSFFVTYARIDDWAPGRQRRGRRSLMDAWILARLDETVRTVTASLEAFEPNFATESVDTLLADLSNWYVRRSRRRFWARQGASAVSDADKEAAYATLYEVLVTLVRLLAPFVPFVTEVMYQNLVRAIDPRAAESVHHCRFPEPNEAHRDTELTGEMRLIQRLVSLGHAARNKANRKLRQPLAEVAFALGTAAERDLVEKHAQLIADELNVKRVRLLEAASEVVDFRLNPLPKQLGQKHASRYPTIRQALLAEPAAEAARQLLSGESLLVHAEGQAVTVTPDEVEVRLEAHAGFAAAADGPYVAALDTELTEALLAEGLAREVVRRLQDLRKQADFRVDDRIEVQYAASSRLSAAIRQHAAMVADETLSEAIQPVEAPSGERVESFSFEGETLELGISRRSPAPTPSRRG